MEQFCVAGINVFEIFWRGLSQLNQVWAGLVIRGAELAGRPFWRSCRSACRSTWKLRQVKTHAWISDPGLFRAISAEIRAFSRTPSSNGLTVLFSYSCKSPKLRLSSPRRGRLFGLCPSIRRLRRRALESPFHRLDRPSRRILRLLHRRFGVSLKRLLTRILRPAA